MDYCIIPLSRSKFAKIDHKDADLNRFAWYASKKQYTYYAIRSTPKEDKKSQLMHRIILGRILGRELDDSEKVDHVDGDGLNNQRVNLRLATHAENNRNRRRQRNNKSGYKGVDWRESKKKWRSQIKLEGRMKHLGYFDTPEAAYAAYCEAAKMHYGEFAKV